jgi:hypothetical protein
MYFPEHDGHGDWRLVGLGFMTESQYDFGEGSPRTDDFLSPLVLDIKYCSVHLRPRVLDYRASLISVVGPWGSLAFLELNCPSGVCI